LDRCLIGSQEIVLQNCSTRKINERIKMIYVLNLAMLIGVPGPNGWRGICSICIP
jgi:hypothetical protein